jgi:hypothetical protein
MRQQSDHHTKSMGNETSLSLVPLSIVRTETVLSKLPIHSLSKQKSVNIHICRTNDQGKVDLYWEVSPSRNYGEPRQLAYKVDTLIVNRKIDEEKRPFPQLIRLGSLRAIAEDLHHSMKKPDTNAIKKALHQNAGAYITAKFSYKAKDGTIRRLEAGFTRYSVIFTGQQLPDGRTADAVYIELHPRYRELLNDIHFRPLDYDYLKALKPGAQRFYEILSFRMFSAIKYRRPWARIRYSEYCLFSAQQRYFTSDAFRKQMHKLSTPHLQSEYLARTFHEATTDAQGYPDWWLYYIPGRKAHVEYNAFHRKELIVEDPDELEATIDEEIRETQLEAKGLAMLADVRHSEARALVARFYELFHPTKQRAASPKELRQAARLVTTYGKEAAYSILDYAYHAALRTHYEPHTFTGIVKYDVEAVAEMKEINTRCQDEAIIAACSLCTHSGYIILEGTGKTDSITLKCPHNLEKIQVLEKQRGLHYVHLS